MNSCCNAGPPRGLRQGEMREVGVFGAFFSIIYLVIFLIRFAVLAAVVMGVAWVIHVFKKKNEVNSSALNILKERYARGEIGEDEFKRMRKDLSQ
jgi:putative membrane protein